MVSHQPTSAKELYSSVMVGSAYSALSISSLSTPGMSTIYSRDDNLALLCGSTSQHRFQHAPGCVVVITKVT